MFAKNDENKRNQLWRTVMSVTTVLIILIAAFFIVRLFGGNPLEGEWQYEDSDMTLTIGEDNTALVTWPEKFSGSSVAVELEYTVDKESKIFSLHADADALAEAAEASGGVITADELSSALDSLESSFDYSIEQQQLTLTEREYGEQMIFDRQE